MLKSVKEAWDSLEVDVKDGLAIVALMVAAGVFLWWFY